MSVDVDFDQVLRVFDPKRYDALLDELYIILHEEVNRAVMISKMVFCPVDTGYMQSTIGVIDASRIGLYIVFGTQGCYYALYVEFGYMSRSGKSVPARPFIRPTAWEALFRIRDRCEAAVARWANP